MLFAACVNMEVLCSAYVKEASFSFSFFFGRIKGKKRLEVLRGRKEKKRFSQSLLFLMFDVCVY